MDFLKFLGGNTDAIGEVGTNMIGGNTDQLNQAMNTAGSQFNIDPTGQQSRMLAQQDLAFQENTAQMPHAGFNAKQFATDLGAGLKEYNAAQAKQPAVAAPKTTPGQQMQMPTMGAQGGSPNMSQMAGQMMQNAAPAMANPQMAGIMQQLMQMQGQR